MFLKKEEPLQHEVYNTKGIALNGYDMVAIVDQATIIKGNEEMVYPYKKVNWHFSSQENLEKFKNNPEHYIPQYGGYCAFGMSRGYKATTEIETWTLVGDKLFLNYNLEVKNDWLQNQQEFIKMADSNWATFKHKD